MSRRPRVAIITSFPRAQRVHVYNEMARLGEVDFKVFYLRRLPHGRHWKYGPPVEHNAVFIREIRLRPHLYFSPGLFLAYVTYHPDLMIMTQYASPAMQFLMYFESLRRRPWVFWAEVPHVRYAEDPIIANQKLRTLFRNLALLPVRYWPREVWAVGTRAVNVYRQLVVKRIPVKNLPYYADLNRFFTAGEHRSYSSSVRFLFSGSLSLRKGGDLVAEAIQILSEEGHQFEVQVAGTGPLASNFRRLSKKAREKVCLHGFLQLNNMPRLYAKTDVLLFPSRHDGWGMTLLEGMAAGMPVISTAQTGSAVDMVVDGENGFLLPKPNTDLLLDSMRRFIEKPELIIRMRKRALETASHYTHSAGARTFLDMIHAVLERIGCVGRE